MIRVKRVLFILLQIIVSAEITLQVLGLAEPWWSSRAGDLPQAADSVTVLCVGDSHTYGAPLPEEESYPSQLQAKLDARSPGVYRVVNLGIPGINSAMVSNRFEDNLVRYRPDLVILWVGANNIWNEKETEHWDSETDPGWLRRSVYRLKLVRLYLFLRGGVAQANLDRAEQLNWEKGRSVTWRQGNEIISMERVPGVTVEVGRAARGAATDLSRMVKTARALGIPLLLVTYPYVEFNYANKPARQVARELDVELLETLDDRQRAEADGYTWDDLIVMAAGPHPRAPLYGYIADSMLERVVGILESP